jgi:hypothetical protein
MSERAITRLDNQPPAPIIETADEVRRRLAVEHHELTKQALDRDIGAKLVPDPIANDDDATRTLDFVAQIGATIAELKKAHETEKRPFLEAGRAVDDFFKGYRERLSLVKSHLEERLKQFRTTKHLEAKKAQEAKRQRAAETLRLAEIEALRAQEAADEAAKRGDRFAAQIAIEEAFHHREAAAGAAAVIAAPPVKTNLYGEYGTTGFIKERWTFAIENPALIPLGYLMPDERAIQDAIDDGVRDIPGLRIYKEEKFQVRRR